MHPIAHAVNTVCFALILPQRTVAMDASAVSSDGDEFMPRSASARSRLKSRKINTPSSSRPRKKAKTCGPQARQKTPSSSAAVHSRQTAPRGPPASASAERPPSRGSGLLRACLSDPPDQAGDLDSGQAHTRHQPTAAQQLDVAGSNSSSGSLCPVCSTDLATISETEAGRAAHVNACLDAGADAAAVSPDAPGSPPIVITDTQVPGELSAGEEEQADAMQQW